MSLSSNDKDEDCELRLQFVEMKWSQGHVGCHANSQCLLRQTSLPLYILTSNLDILLTFTVEYFSSQLYRKAMED